MRISRKKVVIAELTSYRNRDLDEVFQELLDNTMDANILHEEANRICRSTSCILREDKTVTSRVQDPTRAKHIPNVHLNFGFCCYSAPP